MATTSVADTVTRSSAWYAIYTKHQHEKSAADLLAKKGLEIFLPVYRTAHRWKDRTQLIWLPLFPCYVFVRTTLDRKLDVLRTPGVFWLVESGGHACVVPESEIEPFRRVAQTSVRMEPHPYVKCGDTVSVRFGPLAGIEGVLEKFKNQYRVILSVELLQKSVAVEVELSAIERLSRPSGTAERRYSEMRRHA